MKSLLTELTVLATSNHLYSYLVHYYNNHSHKKAGQSPACSLSQSTITQIVMLLMDTL